MRLGKKSIKQHDMEKRQKNWNMERSGPKGGAPGRTKLRTGHINPHDKVNTGEGKIGGSEFLQGNRPYDAGRKQGLTFRRELKGTDHRKAG